MNIKQYLFLPLYVAIYFIGNLFSAHSVSAQATSDGTTGTTVNADGNNFEINDGTRNGANLFHSFQDFSVPNGGTASFNNAVDVDNILSRVTGGNISNIEGLIRANGSANLFLINPAGIIFGEGGRLDIGGSFYGSTADSILFDDGEFSAVNNLDAPILTINAPIGLSFRENPSSITNRSFVQNSNGEFVGLEVASGNTIGLIGGDINFEAGEVTALGGQIELGGLADAGTVTINQDGSLTFPKNVAKGNATFTDGTDVDVTGTGGGSISVNANNLEISGGEEFGNSIFRAGITADSTSIDAQAGDINLNARSLSITDGSQIQNSLFGANENSEGGKGNAGNIIISVEEDFLITGSDADGFISAIFSDVDSGTEGNAGNIIINANSFSLSEGASVISGTVGSGNAGNITISANSVSLSEEALLDSSTEGNGNAGDIRINSNSLELVDSAIISTVFDSAIGVGGDITLTGQVISLSGESLISTSTFPNGENIEAEQVRGGNIELNVGESLTLSEGFALNTGTFGVGNAGNIKINGKGADIILEDNISTSNEVLTASSAIFSSTNSIGNAGDVLITAKSLSLLDGGTIDSSNLEGTGNAGNIAINTNFLILENGAVISAITSGQGNGGNVSVNAAESVTLDGTKPDGESKTVIVTSVFQEAIGNGGSIEITTPNLSISNGAGIFASTSGQGNSGSVSIYASESVTVDGTTPNGEFSSAISTSAFQGAVGNGGSIEITTPDLLISNGAGVFATTSGQGNAGNLIFNIDNRLTLDGNSSITAQAAGTDASGGNIFVNAQSGFVIAFPQDQGNGNDISAFSSQGAGGNITIEAQGVFGIEERDNIAGNSTNDIDASGEFNTGNVKVITPDIDAVQGSTELSTTPVQPGQTIAQACSGQGRASSSNLVIRGKGGIPKPAFGIFDSELLAIGQITENHAEEVKPILTSKGKIIPAQGVEITEDGEIILTAYKTDNNSRVPKSVNCNPT